MSIEFRNIEEQMANYHVPGVSIAILENGSIQEHCYGVREKGTASEINKHTILNACSISKFATSMLVMVLVEQGILDLDVDINKTVKGWKVPRNTFTVNKPVTLRNLLSHQAGIKDPKNSFGSIPLSEKTPTIIDLLQGKSRHCNSPIEPSYIIESEFHYSDAGFCIIQQIIEENTSKTFIEAMSEYILKPLKMKNSTYLHSELWNTTKCNNFSSGHNKNGEVVEGKYPVYPYFAASGLWTTPIDLALLVLELVNGLKGTSKLHLSKHNIQEIIQAQGSMHWAGLGIFLDYSKNHLELASFGWGIGFQSMIVAYPYLDKAMVIMTNADLGVHQLQGIIGELYNEFVETSIPIA
ncbi:serine hydrolase domain-containing protein [Salirhabdus sp. Marseille-P4669]|uniref:serine hydrolase domain-containing protein n=1 Tax=Salirhabdus sp. Marseille-P4669 TaxID=2042310 RepID=UPI000C7B4563|nr:serine hydrolase domain-containing protein [Salirhabdus sp. Marseille-P4669]